jgi:PAS domain S-box-containing protein
VRHSPTDLAGLKVHAEDFLAAVLQTAAQPIWVVDPSGLIRFANPAAAEALGYDVPNELLGRDSHETIHYKHPDGSPYPASECPMLRPRVTGETVARDLDWFFRRDGSMFPVSYVSVPIEMPEGRGAVVAFTDIEDRLRAEQVLRKHDALLAAQQASLRRVAMLVAGGAASAAVFAAIAREVGQLLGLPLVQVWRYESDGTATVAGAWNEGAQPFKAGSRWPLDGPLGADVKETGRPARVDDVANVPGTIADAAREAGIRSGASVPIVVDGEIWGAMSAAPNAGAPLPEHIEDRLAEFTELVATAISNATSREQLARVADEQAALRRVATLVARESPAAQVFAAVAEEVGRLLRVEDTSIIRYEDDGTVTAVANWSERDASIPVGTRVPSGGENIASLVLRTGQPARIDDYAGATGALGDYVRELGVRSAVGTPIVVEGRLWGAMIAASWQAEPPLADTESRIGEFTELVATAIANLQARSDLAASRARIMEATDEERRRVVRDLHDGAQQGLVNTVITLQMARRALENGEETVPALVTEALDQAEQATAELRELSRGILPVALTHGGLREGVSVLASRTPVPVEIDVSVGRLPAAVEATAYFVVAEGLTNVAKHSRAERALVTARIADGVLRVQVRDDGIGGARLGGSGLLGLADRLAVLDGQLQVESPADGGTLVAAAIPLPD